MDWNEQIKEAIEFIEKQISNSKLSNKMIAEYIHVSESNLTVAFRILTDYTLAEYIRNRRLSLAGELFLKEENYSVIDVAQEVGYESPEAFSKAFKRFHGVNPRDCKGEDLKKFYPFKIKVILTQNKPMDFYIDYKDEIYLSGKCDWVDKESYNDTSYLWARCEVNGFLNECYSLKNYENIVGVIDKEKYTIRAKCTKRNSSTVIAIPKSNWIVFKCNEKGAVEILKLWDQINTYWIPENNYKILDYPKLEVYNYTKDGYSCEIWIPIK